LPSIDPIVIRRSARDCPEYGPDFRYGHFAVVGSLPAVGAALAGTAGLVALAQLAPARGALARLKVSGSGPDPARRAGSWFRIRFVATAGEQQIVTEVSGADPGYGETAKMLGESALSLALDRLPDKAGQLTPVAAMGPQLLMRLTGAGLRFASIDLDPGPVGPGAV
jgi:saccharopine dehydrogenase (NAD+, L-glutamate forming)